MVKREKVRIIQTDLLEHPAYLAWRELQSGSVKSERTEILKEERPNHNHGFKRLACRLVGVSLGGASVIGKRCRPSQAEIENTIYEEILPYLSIPSLNYYGMVEEANGEYCWLFLEDAGEREYSALLEEHRLLSAQWLALMHTSAPHIGQPAKLPDKGLKHYLSRLQIARDTILHIITSHTIQTDDLEPLEAIITQCDFLEAHWDQVEDLCQGLPQTIVHGDFAPKNLRIRSNHNGMTFLPFDWSEAGWGSPATDIMHLQPDAYWSNVRGPWPWLSLQDIQRSAKAGKIFHYLDAIYWGLCGFEHEVLNKILGNRRIYESRLADTIEAARLID